MNENYIDKFLPSSYNKIDKNKIYNGINELYNKSTDELYIIVNAIKYIYENEDIFTNNQYRKTMFDDVTTQDFTGLDEKDACLVHYCLVFDAMINKIMQHIIEYYKHSDDLKLLLGEYNESNKITSRYKVLVVVLLCLYKNGDIDKYLKYFCDNACKLSNNEKSQIDDSDHTSALEIYTNKIFKLFHNIRTKCGELNYNEHSDAVDITFIFTYALAVFKHSNNETDRLRPQMLYNNNKNFNHNIKCFIKLALVTSMYLRDKKHAWFDMQKFNDFIEKHGKIMLLFGNYVLCREKFNVLYSLIVIYMYRNEPNSTNNAPYDTKRLSELEDYITSNNNTVDFTIPVRGSSPRLLVINKRNNDDNDDAEYKDTYIIYDVCADTKGNIYKVCYSMDEFVNELKQFFENRNTNHITAYRVNTGYFKMFMIVVIITMLIIIVIAYN